MTANSDNLPWQRGSKILDLTARMAAIELERMTGRPFPVEAFEVGTEGSLGVRIALVLLLRMDGRMPMGSSSRNIEVESVFTANCARRARRLFWIPNQPLYTTLREQTVVDGRAVWKTVYVAGPEPAWELIGVLSLLLAVIGWFAGAEWRSRRQGRAAP